ncbi:LytR/AlgR family response regulator transcription factor [Microscilla marina]|uniref:Two-component system response regulator n=1 Tax=Microscilla marina ATCC 23134 TaxID=313606 RepID=A1ZYJ5_MICM2|nr:LytTR family DNA-binding domain-containing protein [Microscilla marina]EAY24579.1 two-component system response regulator [Microscilla marina ATCC 23134]
MNVLVVEDERRTAELLTEFIEAKATYLVVQVLDSVEATVNYLKKHQTQIDIMFLDIQLADGQSFVVFEQVEVTIPVIFCTAYDEFVMKALKNNGIDYILKPFKEQDIYQSLAKVQNLQQALGKNHPNIPQVAQQILAQAPYPADQPTLQRSFLVRYRDKMVPVEVTKIAFFHLDNDTVHVYGFDGEKQAIFKRLDEIEAVIDRQLFFRINRQMIVNRVAVKDIEPYFNRKMVVNLHFAIPDKAIVSRLKVTPFLEWLERPR